MRIRLTQERDLPAIDKIFALGRERQHSEGNYSQWREDYPTIAVVREDIKNGTGFVCVDDDDSTVLGTWALGAMRRSMITSKAVHGALSVTTKLFTAWALCQAMGLVSSSCNICKRTTLICG